MAVMLVVGDDDGHDDGHDVDDENVRHGDAFDNVQPTYRKKHFLIDETAAISA